LGRDVQWPQKRVAEEVEGWKWSSSELIRGLGEFREVIHRGATESDLENRFLIHI